MMSVSVHLPARERERAQRRVPGGIAIACLGLFAVWLLTIGVCLIYLQPAGEPLGRINDFVVEAEPSLRSLFHGHLLQFIDSSPAYIGSLILRAPFSILAMAAHARWEILYCATSVPCVAAAPLLGAWLSARLPADIHVSRKWLVLSPLGLLLAINPFLFYCVELGHPEDILGAALVIASVVQAARGKPGWAAFLVGVAVVNKSWALVGVPVTLVVLPRRHVRAIAILAVTVGVVYLPIELIRGGASGGLGSSTGTIFEEPQLWYWFGPGSWISVHAHELIVVAAFACAAAWRVLRSDSLMAERDRWREGLILLALVLLLRAAMDPWDNVYYQLPFLMTIYALEIGRPPRLSFIVTIVLLAVTIPIRNANIDARVIGYQIVALSLIGILAARTYLRAESWQRLVAMLRRERIPVGGRRTRSSPA
jgi:hypothetical protein